MYYPTVSNAFALIAEQSPKSKDGSLQWNVDQVMNVQIHSDKTAMAGANKGFEALSDHPGFFAFHPNAVLFAAGKDGLQEIKNALTNLQNTRRAPMLALEVMGSKAAGFASGSPASNSFAKASRKLAHGEDRMGIKISGGEEFKVAVEMNLKLVAAVAQER